RFHARLADSTTFEARDATTRDRVSSRYGAPEIDGGWIAVESAAESLMAGGAPLFPSQVLIGASAVPALSVVLRHPGAAGTARVRLDTLRVDCRDATRNPIAPATYFTRMTV